MRRNYPPIRSLFIRFVCLGCSCQLYSLVEKGRRTLTWGSQKSTRYYERYPELWSVHHWLSSSEEEKIEERKKYTINKIKGLQSRYVAGVKIYPGGSCRLLAFIWQPFLNQRFISLNRTRRLNFSQSARGQYRLFCEKPNLTIISIYPISYGFCHEYGISVFSNPLSHCSPNWPSPPLRGCGL